MRTGHLRFATSDRTDDKGCDLLSQRLFFFDCHRFAYDLPSLFPVNFAALSLIIEREIGVLLKDANFAHSLRADSAGSNVRNAAACKSQSCVGNIFSAAEHGHAYGIDVFDGRTHQMQNDLQIMNHQIEDDSDIGAAIRIGRESMCFDKSRMSEPLLECAQDRIETFHMTDL